MNKRKAKLIALNIARELIDREIDEPSRSSYHERVMLEKDFDKVKDAMCELSDKLQKRIDTLEKRER